MGEQYHVLSDADLAAMDPQQRAAYKQVGPEFDTSGEALAAVAGRSAATVARREPDPPNPREYRPKS